MTSELERRLAVLTNDALLSFATACLERSLPAFERRVGATWGVPHNTVNLAWSAIGGEPVVRHRWHRMRAFNERIGADIEKYGPNLGTSNAIAASGKLLAEMFGFASSGNLEFDLVERARRARLIANNTIDAIDALQREEGELAPGLTFPATADSERAWQLEALSRIRDSGNGNPGRSLFEEVEVPASDTGRGLDGSLSGWFAWPRERVRQGHDLTVFVGGFRKTPQAAYYVFEARNELAPHGAQATGAEVAFVREVARVGGVARFSYHLRDARLADDIDFIIYHVLAGEFMRHDFDDCREIRFRNLDTDTRRTVPYPPHSVAEDDL